MASALLQLNPDDRIGAEEGLKHPYFAQLPNKLYELPDGEFRRAFITNFIPTLIFSSTETTIFSVEGIYLYPEPNRDRHNNWNLRKAITMDDICFFYCWTHFYLIKFLIATTFRHHQLFFYHFPKFDQKVCGIVRAPFWVGCESAMKQSASHRPKTLWQGKWRPTIKVGKKSCLLIPSGTHEMQPQTTK